MLKAAIAIITRDRMGILPKAIASATGQLREGMAVWVLDDASSDGTRTLRGRFPDVRWIRSDLRLGIPAARARLLREVDAEYLCNLDDDAWFLEADALNAAVAFLDAKPDVAVVGFDVLAAGREARRMRGEPIPSHTFPGCAHVLRVSVVREVGGFAEFPGFYGCEEKDLAIRLLDAGHEVMIFTGVHVWHDKTSVARDLLALHASGVCNDLAWVARRYPFSCLIWGLPLKVLSHLKFSARMGLLGACVRGIGAFLWAASALLATREPVSLAALRKYRRRASAGPCAYDKAAWT